MGQLNDDLYVNGLLSAKQQAIPAGTITDAAVAANAAIQATKLQHQHRRNYVTGSGTTAAAATQVIHTVYGATGTIIAFRAGAVVANVGAATCTVDLKKNGTSVLTSPISLSVSQTARQMVAGTFSGSVALVANDVLEVVVTATAGGGTLAQGLFAELSVNELPAP